MQFVPPLSLDGRAGSVTLPPGLVPTLPPSGSLPPGAAGAAAASGSANQLVVGSYPAAITAQPPPATGTITTADAMATEGALRGCSGKGAVHKKRRVLRTTLLHPCLLLLPLALTIALSLLRQFRALLQSARLYTRAHPLLQGASLRTQPCTSSMCESSPPSLPQLRRQRRRVPVFALCGLCCSLGQLWGRSWSFLLQQRPDMVLRMRACVPAWQGVPWNLPLSICCRPAACCAGAQLCSVPQHCQAALNPAPHTAGLLPAAAEPGHAQQVAVPPPGEFNRKLHRSAATVQAGPAVQLPAAGVTLQLMPCLFTCWVGPQPGAFMGLPIHCSTLRSSWRTCRRR